MISNIDAYLAIAEESHAEMTRLLNASRRSKPDGSPGHIITPDPNRGSFKHALVCIVFAGMYFEALIYVTARTRLSKTKAATIDGVPYENRLEALGVFDPELCQKAKEFRVARRGLVHEKAILPTEIASEEFWMAQDVANDAIALVRAVTATLSGAP
jgi:hypothetical protein